MATTSVLANLPNEKNVKLIYNDKGDPLLFLNSLMENNWNRNGEDTTTYWNVTVYGKIAEKTYKLIQKAIEEGDGLPKIQIINGIQDASHQNTHEEYEKDGEKRTAYKPKLFVSNYSGIQVITTWRISSDDKNKEEKQSEKPVPDADELFG